MNNEKVAFLWFVENYSYCWHKNGETLDSPYFTFPAYELEGTSWWISLSPRGRGQEHKGWISLHLCRNPDDNGPEEISLNYELSILAADGSTRCSEVSNYTFKRNVGRGWPEFLLMDSPGTSQDILTVRCRIWRGEGWFCEIAPICARTRIAVKDIFLLHEVENFSTLDRNQKKTVKIRCNSKKECVVSVSVYFTRDSSFEEKMMVEIMPSDSNHVLCKRKISLVDASGNLIGCGESDNRSDAEREDIRKLPLSLTRRAILDKKSEYLPDDKLSLLCECAFSIKQEFSKIGETRHGIVKAAVKLASNRFPAKNGANTVEKTSAHPSALEDMKVLYANQHLTDVEVKTKTRSFPVHKIVLCARSPVFDAMMNNDMKEKNTNCIEIDDLEDDIVEQLLFFLYSDSLENLQWNDATQLYYAGDKYQIGKLKEVSSSFLVENLTAANAGELLVLADTYSDANLKQSVEDFILQHEKAVFSSKEWEMLMEENLPLASKTMHLKYKR